MHIKTAVFLAAGKFLGLSVTAIGLNLLPLHEFGRFIVWISWGSLMASVAVLGINNALNHYIAAAENLHSRRALTRTAVVALPLVMTISITIAALSYSAFGFLLSAPPELMWYMTAQVALLSFAEVLAGVLRGWGRVPLSILVGQIVPRGSHLIGILSGVISVNETTDLKILAIAQVSSLGAAVAGFAGLLFIVHVRHFRGSVYRFDKSFIKYAAHSWGASILSVATSRGDAIVLGGVATPQTVAIVNSALSFSSIFLFPFQLYSPHCRIEATKLHAKRRLSDLITVFERYRQLLVIMVGAMLAGACIFIALLHQIKFQSEFRYVGQLTLVVGSAHIIRALIGPSNSFLYAIESPKRIFQIDLVTGVLYLVGIVGAFSAAGELAVVAWYGFYNVLQQVAKKYAIVLSNIPINRLIGVANFSVVLALIGVFICSLLALFFRS